MRFLKEHVNQCLCIQIVLNLWIKFSEFIAKRVIFSVNFQTETRRLVKKIKNRLLILFTDFSSSGISLHCLCDLTGVETLEYLSLSVVDENLFYVLSPQTCNFVKKETLAQVFSCEFYEISKNTSFTEHLRTTASTFMRNSWSKETQKIEEAYKMYKDLFKKLRNNQKNYTSKIN